jgi:Spy/CpxP family protein refolding chaperone
LKSLTENEPFDEAQVQTIANQQGAIAAQIIVEKERAKWEIFQILTVEQRAQAKLLKEQMKERFKGSRFRKLPISKAQLRRK